MQLLGIDVPDDLVLRWRRSLAPEWQPFFVDAGDAWPAPDPPVPLTITDDLRCTYTLWFVRDRTTVVWFDERSFMALPRDDRSRLVRAQVARRRGAVPTVRRWRHEFDAARLREQADGHRFVWWPSLLDERPEAVLADHVLDGQPASRHAEVGTATWRACRRVLPGAEELAGGFPEWSGPNCFGTTVAAAGHGDARTRVLQDGFDEFLAEACVPGGDDGDAGTVLVWRDAGGLPVHSAVTLGDGWALEKPAETWWTPRVVLDTRQLVRVNRGPGKRLERHRIVARTSRRRRFPTPNS